MGVWKKEICEILGEELYEKYITETIVVGNKIVVTDNESFNFQKKGDKGVICGVLKGCAGQWFDITFNPKGSNSHRIGYANRYIVDIIPNNNNPYLQVIKKRLCNYIKRPDFIECDLSTLEDLAIDVYNIKTKIRYLKERFNRVSEELSQTTKK